MFSQTICFKGQYLTLKKIQRKLHVSSSSVHQMCSQTAVQYGLNIFSPKKYHYALLHIDNTILELAPLSQPAK